MARCKLVEIGTIDRLECCSYMVAVAVLYEPSWLPLFVFLIVLTKLGKCGPG